MSNNQQEGSTTHFKMAEKKTPAINAPLLLMSASDGLNLNPALGSNLFMPVAPQQNENLSGILLNGSLKFCNVVCKTE